MNAGRENMTETKRMFGMVEHDDGRYYIVVCPDAPAHLQRLNLIRGQMAGAHVGDRVELEYQTTSRSGLWNVIRIVCPFVQASLDNPFYYADICAECGQFKKNHET